MANFYAADSSLTIGARVNFDVPAGGTVADLVASVPAPAEDGITTNHGADLRPTGAAPAATVSDPFPEAVGGVYVG